MQAYWVDNEHGNQQFSLPFTFLYEQQRWVPRRSVFLMDPSQTNWAQVWNVGCIDCHATAGQPRQGAERGQFTSRVAELGIACEACHGPAADHVRLNQDPLRRYRRHLGASFQDAVNNPGRLSSKRASEVCGRCHSVHAPHQQSDWLQNGESFKPGDDLETSLQVLRHPKSSEFRRSLFWSDGMIRVSGREYNGLIKSACYLKGDLSCLSCHSMHESSPTNQLARAMDGNAACLPCHKTIGDTLTQHTHHSPGSSGSLCYNCHMPYTSYGLVRALRSHQISNPSVKASLQSGRPNACNLCHLDKSLSWTIDNLSAWYRMPVEEIPSTNQTIAASILWAVQGDAGQRALLAWHMGWQPAREASGEGWLAPYLASLLDDPYSAVRLIAGRSLKRLRGYTDLTYDYLAEPEQRQRARGRVMEAWSSAAKPGANPALLLDQNGHLEATRFANLAKSRNDRVIELNE
jgi:predicted CXXCH cytochrome family protein